MKIFIAIHFDALTHMNTKKMLMNLRDDLKKESNAGSFAPQENMNMILANLGECDERRMITAVSAMFAAAKDVSLKPFDLEIDRVDRFQTENGDTWWAGFKKSELLAKFQRALIERLKEEDFKMEEDKFEPYIELGRRIETDTKPFTLEEPFKVMVEKIDVMKLRFGCGLTSQESMATCKLG